MGLGLGLCLVGCRLFWSSRFRTSWLLLIGNLFVFGSLRGLWCCRKLGTVMNYLYLLRFRHIDNRERCIYYHLSTTNNRWLCMYFLFCTGLGQHCMCCLKLVVGSCHHTALEEPYKYFRSNTICSRHSGTCLLCYMVLGQNYMHLLLKLVKVKNHHNLVGTL